jgi:hypothetical protein
MLEAAARINLVVAAPRATSAAMPVQIFIYAIAFASTKLFIQTGRQALPRKPGSAARIATTAPIPRAWQGGGAVRNHQSGADLPHAAISNLCGVAQPHVEALGANRWQHMRGFAHERNPMPREFTGSFDRKRK